MNRQLLWTLLVASSMGLVVGIQLANAAPPSKRVCGGDPAKEDKGKRTNNANCYGCDGMGCETKSVGVVSSLV